MAHNQHVIWGIPAYGQKGADGKRERRMSIIEIHETLIRLSGWDGLCPRSRIPRVFAHDFGTVIHLPSGHQFDGVALTIGGLSPVIALMPTNGWIRTIRGGSTLWRSQRSKVSNPIGVIKALGRRAAQTTSQEDVRESLEVGGRIPTH